MPAMGVEEYTGKGLFSSAGAGRAFRHRRRKTGALDRFAEELSHHSIADGDLGGDARASAQRAGCRPEQGNAMLQRIRKRLGWQAK